MKYRQKALLQAAPGFAMWSPTVPVLSRARVSSGAGNLSGACSLRLIDGRKRVGERVAGQRRRRQFQPLAGGAQP
jgi:hypothetical protein